MATIFTRIVEGQIPCYKIAEDEKHLAFLDVKPLKRGHTLVIPKREVDYIFDLSDEETAQLHTFARRVARAVDATIPCKRVGVAVIGLEVPHVHIHLIPLDKITDTDFGQPRLDLSEAEFKEIAATIAAAV